MDADQTIRSYAIEIAKQLALNGTSATETNAIIAEANKIAAFISAGTVPE